MKEIAIGVIVGLIVLLLAAFARTAWRRRFEALRWTTRIKAFAERLRNRSAAMRRQELVSSVRMRAQVLSIDVADEVSRRGDVTTVTYWPSNHRKYFVQNLDRYRQLLQAGQLPPDRTFAKGYTGKPVHRWSSEELREWLRKHANELPPERRE